MDRDFLIGKAPKEVFFEQDESPEIQQTDGFVFQKHLDQLGKRSAMRSKHWWHEAADFDKNFGWIRRFSRLWGFSFLLFRFNTGKPDLPGSQKIFCDAILSTHQLTDFRSHIDTWLVLSCLLFSQPPFWERLSHSRISGFHIFGWLERLQTFHPRISRRLFWFDFRLQTAKRKKTKQN